MFGPMEAIVRAKMAERARATTRGAQYQEWCRIECPGCAGETRNG